MKIITKLLRWRRSAFFGAVMSIGLLPSFSPVLWAADQRVSQLPGQTSPDWLLTNAARRAIQKDEQLEAMNIGVTVTNKVATIWGNIPSPEAAKRATVVLAKIKGITKVVNDCRVVPNDTLAQSVADAVKKGRVVVEDPATSAKLTVWPAQPAAVPTRVVAKPNPNEVAPKAVGDENEVAPGSPLLPPPPTVVLLSPVLAETPADQDDSERARRSEPRFKDVVLEVKDGVVTINGQVTRMKDAWDLAEKLNLLSSVKQVVFGNVSEK